MDMDFRYLWILVSTVTGDGENFEPYAISRHPLGSTDDSDHPKASDTIWLQPSWSCGCTIVNNVCEVALSFQNVAGSHAPSANVIHWKRGLITNLVRSIIRLVGPVQINSIGSREREVGIICRPLHLCFHVIRRLLEDGESHLPEEV